VETKGLYGIAYRTNVDCMKKYVELLETEFDQYNATDLFYQDSFFSIGVHGDYGRLQGVDQWFRECHAKNTK
jgi:hypothetical protein